MDLVNDNTTLSELDTSSNSSSDDSISSSDESSSSSISSDSSSDSQDSMEIVSDEDSVTSDSSMDISDQSSVEEMSTSESSEEEDEDSSSDYEPPEEPQTKKRKRNSLDTFCIYTIRPLEPTDENLYVGSTINFNRRLAQHKKAVTNKRGKSYNTPLYKYIRYIGGWDKVIMAKHVDFPCETKREGLLKEKMFIRKLGATLNSINPVANLIKKLV